MKPHDLICCASHRQNPLVPRASRTRYPQISSGPITKVPSAIQPRQKRARVVARGVLSEHSDVEGDVYARKAHIEKETDTGSGKEVGNSASDERSRGEIETSERRKHATFCASLALPPITQQTRHLHFAFIPPTRADHHASPLRGQAGFVSFQPTTAAKVKTLGIRMSLRVA